MSAQSVLERYVELILGPAGVDELPLPGVVQVAAADPASPLAVALVERVRALDGFAEAFVPGQEPRLARTGALPPSQIVLKCPRLTQDAVRVDPGWVLQGDGSWPQRTTVAPCPTEEWAARLWPGEPSALERLWKALEYVCRLDSEDPDGAWHRRHDELLQRARILDQLEIDRLHLADATSGTDITLGLLPGSRWINGRAKTAGGADFVPNIPCEELFTAPDPSRIEGRVVCPHPLLLGETSVENLRIEFAPGEDARFIADAGERELGELLSVPNGLRLGEVALVDRDSRAGELGIPFGDTLLDENAGCHVAFGGSIPGSYDAREHERANRASRHIDVVIGGRDTDATAHTRGGDEIPLLRAGTWQGDLALEPSIVDSARIPALLATIGAVWRRDPDLRLGQLIRGTVPALHSDMGLETTADDEVLRAFGARAAVGNRVGSALGRDPARISPLLEALEARWSAEPDRSLCQLLRRVARGAGFCGDARFALMEDDLWLAGLRGESS